MPTEAHILKAVLDLCRRHPKVARAWRQNTGMARLKGFYVRFGEEGHSDIQGYMKDGRFLAIETKRPGECPTEAQNEFLSHVRVSGGVSGMATSVESAKAILDAA